MDDPIVLGIHPGNPAAMIHLWNLELSYSHHGLESYRNSGMPGVGILGCSSFILVTGFHPSSGETTLLPLLVYMVG